MILRPKRLFYSKQNDRFGFISMPNKFVRDTCTLIRHDATDYNEDAWGKETAMAAGGYIKRKAGQAYGAAKQRLGNAIGSVGRDIENNAGSQRGAMLGRSIANAGNRINTPGQRRPKQSPKQAGYVRRKLGQAYGAARRRLGNVIGTIGRDIESNAGSQRGAMFGRRMRNVAYKMSPSQRNAL